MYRTILPIALALLFAGCAGHDRGDAARGRHLATVMGCISCHGDKIDGHLFQEDARFAVAWSSNLSQILPHWSDAQVEATMRTGRRPDGSALWFMPTFAHRRLSPTDMRDLIAWLRSVPPSGGRHPPMKPGPLFRQAQAHGFQNSADEAVRLAAREPRDVGARFAKGRYLASISCAECHGPDLKGVRNPQPGDPPDLVAAAAYDSRAFARLLKTGVKQNGRPAELMAQEAPKRLSALDADEVAAIFAYLRARAANSPP